LIDRFNEEMIESLFGCHATDKKNADGKKDLAAKDTPQFVRILDAKKAQNLAISLKALSVSADEVRNAVMEGKADHLLGLFCVIYAAETMYLILMGKYKLIQGMNSLLI
jgi:hypothetical protein